MSQSRSKLTSQKLDKLDRELSDNLDLDNVFNTFSKFLVEQNPRNRFCIFIKQEFEWIPAAYTFSPKGGQTEEDVERIYDNLSTQVAYEIEEDGKTCWFADVDEFETKHYRYIKGTETIDGESLTSVGYCKNNPVLMMIMHGKIIDHSHDNLDLIQSSINMIADKVCFCKNIHNRMKRDVWTDGDHGDDVSFA